MDEREWMRLGRADDDGVGERREQRDGFWGIDGGVIGGGIGFVLGGGVAEEKGFQ